LSLTVFTQRNFVADFLQPKCDSRQKTFYVFESNFRGLRGNAQWSSSAHWKAHSGFSINVNWTFFARCYGWGAPRAIMGWKSAISLQRGSVDPKFQVDGIASYQPFFFSEN